MTDKQYSDVQYLWYWSKPDKSHRSLWRIMNSKHESGPAKSHINVKSPRLGGTISDTESNLYSSVTSQPPTLLQTGQHPILCSRD